MKNKKLIIISGIVALALIIGALVYFVLTKQDKTTTLNIFDKQWIESHKNSLIDIEIETDVPVFNYNGNGVFFDFLTDFEKNVGLEFNRVPKKNNNSEKYAFEIVDKADKNDILIYQDNYVLVGKNHQKYASLSDIKNITVGVLESELESANKYLKGSQNISLKTFSNLDSLFKGLENEEEKIDNAIVLKNLYMDEILKNNLYINYNLSDYTKDYVLSLGNEDKLNSILKKYYAKWKSDNYEESYQNNFLNEYFLFNNITDKEKVSFEGKQYVYGFVANAPYDLLVEGKLNGINASILRNFSKLTGVKIEFKEYENVEQLINKFNENKIDFFFNNTSVDKFDMDVVNTISTFDEKIVYLTHINNDMIINSISSLEDKKVMVLKGSRISSYLSANNINVQEYNSLNALLDKMNSKSIIALDKENYDYYVHSKLANYKVAFEEKFNVNYCFTLRDINDNKIFNQFFDFYLSFIDEKSNVSDSFSKLLTIKKSKNLLLIIGLAIFAIIGVIYTLKMFIGLLSKLKKGKDKLSKEQKIKYVDMLTSLKNRNYLNDNIEKWDTSEVYPQTILIIDLNNVAYINDNYGHQEGDNLIKEAANILIKTQISNTEIIRTNGNEFLIYMVGYDEKQVISYIRKLNKEFKELAHGFGAAIGYSTINDAIKTIDDAVNEATIDMRSNKEDLQN